ncbi:LacI family DNA-binding transcriptional regulator [Oceanispirochaeta sp.]|uniref:LacI family DNA-binding transcriptional regulator n=1 Tax=Oceanispirochaeta sp. TaxID=2035350 RepID=UPI002633E8AE|nr:LacI family DNA-binding transcriptional regulator [Oceanispirochaeta sp.]MDA3956069.1 LacI family DNA-binding transcriptional regulator [Oceanispirochaeta sp.]
MKVKLEDVALEAGVSIATVSRVLNNHPVKEATRLLVVDTIARMDYRPNLTARGLIKGTSNRIGVIVSNMENPYFSSIMNTMEIRMRKDGYLCNFSSAINRGKDERDIINRYLDSGVDGLILVDVSSKEENMGLYADLNKSIPVVLINGNPDRDDSNLVMVDQRKGMEIAMDYLFALNHKNITFIRGLLDSVAFDIKDRIYTKRMIEAGFPPEYTSIIEIEDTDHYTAIERVEELVLPLLDSPLRPSAIFASNELLGMGVIKAARKLNLSIPDDLSLIAHDNTYLSIISQPTMTTINLNPPRLGAEAAEMMLQLLKQNCPYPRKLIFNPELIVRESSRAL